MKPLLAESVDLTKLQYPVLASAKIDGFRGLIHPSLGPVTRSLKPVKNSYVRGKLGELSLDYLDGEILTYTNGKVDDFNTVQSKLSTRGGMPDFVYMVFDSFHKPNLPYTQRLEKCTEKVWLVNSPRVQLVHQHLINNEEELLEFEGQQLELGWEGIMIRKPDGVYKFGRSTVNEGILLKMKRFKEAEGVIVDQYELMHNANEAVVNELGYTERSSHKDNMVPMGVLGGYTISWNGVEFDLGTGFDADLRARLFKVDNRGKKVTFKYQDVQPSGKPRFPVFRGIRHDI